MISFVTILEILQAYESYALHKLSYIKDFTNVLNKSDFFFFSSILDSLKILQMGLENF